MTNEQKIREKISTTVTLAESLVIYNDGDGRYYVSNGEYFYDRDEAITYEIKWLKSEYNDGYFMVI